MGGTFFAGERCGTGEPCLAAPRLSWNCRTRLRTSGWSVSTCLRGRRRSSVGTLEASHLRRARS